MLAPSRRGDDVMMFVLMSSRRIPSLLIPGDATVHEQKSTPRQSPSNAEALPGDFRNVTNLKGWKLGCGGKRQIHEKHRAAARIRRGFDLAVVRLDHRFDETEP